MAKKRTCDACGERKKLSSGKTCSTGHFICYSCRKSKNLVGYSWRGNCPVCGDRLR
jgi:rRNA maturation protein Nop10